MELKGMGCLFTSASYIFNELQYAHCSAKMEDAIKKIPGVESANINFMMQKLTIEADEENFDKIMEEAQKCCDKIEKGVKIVV